MKKTKRIILDTNWYISATINRKSRRTLYEILTDKRFTVLCSKELIEEYLTVISRPKFVKMITKHQYLRFIKLTLTALKEVFISSKIELSRDKKDDYLLAMAKDGKADFLITGDADLLVLQEFENTKILNFIDFKNINH
jgi:uncharacterized protein